MTKAALQVQTNQNITMNNSVFLMTRGSVPLYLRELAELKVSAKRPPPQGDSRINIWRPRKSHNVMEWQVPE